MRKPCSIDSLDESRANECPIVKPISVIVGNFYWCRTRHTLRVWKCKLNRRGETVMVNKRPIGSLSPVYFNEIRGPLQDRL